MQAVRDVTLILDGSCLLELKDCLYVPKSRKNLISFSSLCKQNYSLAFYKKQVFIKMNDLFICLGSLVDNLYHVTSLFIQSSNENYHVSDNRKEPSINQTQYWHLHLGHINLNMIQKLVKSRILPPLIPKDLPVYESYIEGKMSKRSFIAKGYRAKEYLELVHTKVCGPFNVHAK